MKVNENWDLEEFQGVLRTCSGVSWHKIFTSRYVHDSMNYLQQRGQLILGTSGH